MHSAVDYYTICVRQLITYAQLLGAVVVGLLVIGRR